MPKEFEDIINLLKSLPGIGPKAASRMALFLIQNQEYTNLLSKSMQSTVRDLDLCRQCGNISKKSQLCSICLNLKRDNKKIAIILNISDILAIERTNAYDGLYFVFNDLNLLFEDPERFNTSIEKLEKFININISAASNRESSDPISNNKVELILAFPYSIDSEVACEVIRDNIFNKIQSVSFSRIGLGMPSGADFDYADNFTISKSFKGRTLLG